MSKFYEVIEMEDDSPIKILIHSVNKLEMHWHESMEIIIVLEGSINLRIEDKLFILQENDLVLINSKEIHNTSKTDGDNIILALQIRPEHLNLFYSQFYNMRFECNSVNCSIEEEEKFNRIRHYMGKLIWESNKKTQGYRFLVGNELNSLAYYLLNNFEYYIIEEKSKEITNSDIERLDRILIYINDHIGEKITLKDIAEKEHINFYYLSHFFKSKVGLNFQDYINIMRIEKAKNLLLNSNATITDISNGCGFSSTNYFNKVFKENSNTTPSQYRNNNTRISTSDDIVKVTQTKTKTYLDVDRKAVFKKVYSYIKPLDTKVDDYLISPEHKKITIDIEDSVGTSYTPYWNKLITFGRAAEGLREGVQRQLRQMQEDIKFEYIRFHGIFSDDMMIYSLSTDGHATYNWTYVDELFDFFEDVEIKLFVELGFMPAELARSNETSKWWKANIAPPKDMKLWTELVKEFVKHCINRYGFEEVATWYFEVWNEPEYEGVFWAGTKEEFFEFYKETRLAIKSISKDLRVGGPAVTCGTLINSTWLDDFLEYCNNNKIHLDFLSIHIYPEYIPQSEPTERKKDVKKANLNNDESMIDLNKLDLSAVDINQIDLSKLDLSKIDFSKIDLSKLDLSKTDFSAIDMSQIDLSQIDLSKINYKQIDAYKLKRIYHNDDHTLNMINKVHKIIDDNLDYKPELIITEWNASSLSGNYIHDTAYIATFIIKNVLECLGKVNALGYWTFTDIFEEKKLGISHFHGGFGLINKDGLKKASYYAYYLFKKLGKKIIDKGDDYIVTQDGKDIQILAYNYVYFDELFLSGDTSALIHKNRYDIYEKKPEKSFEFNLMKFCGNYKITRYYLNRENGSVYDEWVKIGAPENMTREEIKYLDGISRPNIKTKNILIEDGYSITAQVPVHGIELISLEKIF